MAIKDLVKQAFEAAAGADSALPLSLTYTRVTVGAYDPATNTRAVTTSNTTIDIAYSVGLTVAEVDYFPANRNTQKLLIAGADLSFIPAETDYVTIGVVRWEIKRIKRIPGDSLFILFVQEP